MTPEKRTSQTTTEEAPWPPPFMTHPGGERRRKSTIAQFPRRATEKWRPAEPVHQTTCSTCLSPCGFNDEMLRRQVTIATPLDEFVALVREGRINDEDFAAAAKLWGANEIADALTGMDNP